MSSKDRKAFEAAVALLARREHAANELLCKLIKRGFSEAEGLAAILECQRLALQSDMRFIESMSNARIRQGYGPERIRKELHSKQLDRELVMNVLTDKETDWLECARKVLIKKYKVLNGRPYQEQQKQKQFLSYRGFSNETITQVFRQILEGCDNE